MPDLTAKRTLVKSPPELWEELSEVERLAKHLGAFGEITITKLEPEHTVAWEGEHASGTVSIEPSGWGTKVTLRAELPEPGTGAGARARTRAGTGAGAGAGHGGPGGRGASGGARRRGRAQPRARRACVDRRSPSRRRASRAGGEPGGRRRPDEASGPGCSGRDEAPSKRSRSRRSPVPEPEAVAEEPSPRPEPEPDPVAEPEPEPDAESSRSRRLRRSPSREPEPEPEPEPVADESGPSPWPRSPPLEIAADTGDDAALDPERARLILDEALDTLGAAHHRPFSRG